MTQEIERELGEQPLLAVLVVHRLKPHDLVAASAEHLTHKMVSRAGKGRRLTVNVQGKILRAVNQAAATAYTRVDLFNY